MTLCSVVSEYLKGIREREGSITFLALYNKFLEAKAHRTAKYRRELEWIRDRLKILHETLVCDITVRTLEPILSAMRPSVRAAATRYLKAVLNYGLKRQFLSDNPAVRLEPVELERREVDTIPVEKVLLMLETALNKDLALLPYLVIGFFCGVRPQGELSKLVWSDLDLSERVLVIRPEISKTKRRRFVTVSENVTEWLEEYRARGGVMTGFIAQATGRALELRRRANWEAAGLKEWIQQGMRHTYCSAFLAAGRGGINDLVLQSGHSNVNTMWESYHRGMKKAEAEKFWAIRPPLERERRVIYIAV
ncbi:MAG TPA: tyrosine-type recombinase/integrase [Chthoniobacterales bacterium]